MTLFFREKGGGFWWICTGKVPVQRGMCTAKCFWRSSIPFWGPQQQQCWAHGWPLSCWRFSWRVPWTRQCVFWGKGRTAPPVGSRSVQCAALCCSAGAGCPAGSAAVAGAEHSGGAPARPAQQALPHGGRSGGSDLPPDRGRPADSTFPAHRDAGYRTGTAGRAGGELFRPVPGRVRPGSGRPACRWPVPVYRPSGHLLHQRRPPGTAGLSLAAGAPALATQTAGDLRPAEKCPVGLAAGPGRS